jgi:hypothetical protein
VLFSLMRSNHSQAALPLERLQQAVTPDVCAELSVRVRALSAVTSATTIKRKEMHILRLCAEYKVICGPCCFYPSASLAFALILCAVLSLYRLLLWTCVARASLTKVMTCPHEVESC